MFLSGYCLPHHEFAVQKAVQEARVDLWRPLDWRDVQGVRDPERNSRTRSARPRRRRRAAWKKKGRETQNVLRA